MMYTVMPYRPRNARPELVMDRMLREFCGLQPRPQHRPGFRVDVKQNDAAWVIEAELPGVKLEEIEITVENDVLTIAADVNRVNREERQGYVHTERRSGHVERRFSLEGVRQEDITASCADGVLTVTLPREAPEAGKEKRRITITGATPTLEAPAAE